MTLRHISIYRRSGAHKGFSVHKGLGILFALTLLAAGCSDSGSDATSTPASGVTADNTPDPLDPEDIVIAEINQGLSAPFPAAVHDGIVARAAELGIEVISFDSDFALDTEANSVQDLLTQNPAAVIFMAVDGAAAEENVNTITSAGVPVLAVHTQVGADRDFDDVYPDLVAFVSQGEVQAGESAGRLALEAVPAGGKVGIVEGSTCCYESVRDRTEGFRSVVDGTLEVVATQPGAWVPDTAEAACQNMLQSNPDITLFYTHSDDMGAGCANAITLAGSNAKVIGIGGSGLGIEGIRTGTLFGTVCYRPFTMGELAVQTLFDSLTGVETLDAELRLYDTPAITADNIGDCEPQW